LFLQKDYSDKNDKIALKGKVEIYLFLNKKKNLLQLKDVS
jgi:hypothetical protein